MEELKVKKKGIYISAKVVYVQDDILILVYGGDKPHIGSCLLANQRELKSICFKHHKDDILLGIMANKLKKHTSKNICLTGGVHIDGITKKQIQVVLKLGEKLAKKIVKSHFPKNI